MKKTKTIIACTADDMHPMNCNGIDGGKCIHCQRKKEVNHDPATCGLCDSEYDFKPNIRQKLWNLVKSHINTVNSFVDDEGKNHFPLLIDDLEALIPEEAEKILKANRDLRTYNPN